MSPAPVIYATELISPIYGMQKHKYGYAPPLISLIKPQFLHIRHKKPELLTRQ